MGQRGIERSEFTSGSQGIRLEGPAVLELEQNLFDQEPFSDILKELSERTGVSLENWRRIFGIVAKDRQRERERQTENLKPESSVTPNEIGRAADSLHTGNPEEIQACRKAWIETESEMDKYPFWTEYVGLILSEGYRKFDGSLINSAKPKAGFYPTPSYDAWLTKKRKSGRDSINVGIAEIFPQDLAGQSIREAVCQTQGRKRSPRYTWIIREALV
ncbi:hypothetical protein M1437_01930 [Patescibacteria group bacterium]|nr:hypothetical protein [Patescibacteria group bacterium]